MDPCTPPHIDLEGAPKIPEQAVAPKMPKLTPAEQQQQQQQQQQHKKLPPPSDDSSRDEDGSPRVRRRKRRRFPSSSSEEELVVKGSRRKAFRVDLDDDSETDSCTQVVHESEELPLGVIQARAGSTGFQLIMTSSRPEAARIPCLDYAPVFYPTEQEFEDTLKYIESIRPLAEPYGICRVVPPKSWKPPCSLKDNAEENIQFTTRVQKIHKLQVREPTTRLPPEGASMGRRSRARVSKTLKFSASMHGAASGPQQEFFGFEPGPNFTIKDFEVMANELKDKYFKLDEPTPDGSRKSEPTVQAIEGEFWRMVETPSEQIEVLYGADIETNSFKSGFPKTKAGSGGTSEKSLYEKSGWNLNNIARLKNSVLEFEDGEISGVVVPWLYVGMCFSSFCWHVEDHHLYSVNYMHWGSPKVWYGVPGFAAPKLEQAMKKRLPALFKEQPDLLHKLVTQMSPSILKEEGVPVYRVVQHSGDFVITFPRAYHAGFNCGFNCAEAVNVAPVNWLPHGQNAVEIYREQRRKTSISHDKLLLMAVKRAIQDDLKVEDKDGSIARHKQMLAKALKTRLEFEASRRQSLDGLVIRKMDDEFDAKQEKECCICAYDLHLSAVGCGCYPVLYACLEHAKTFCSCGWGKKFALYRYDVSVLEGFVRMLEGHSPSFKLKILAPRPQPQVQGSDTGNPPNLDIVNTRNLAPSQSNASALIEQPSKRSGPRVAKVVRPGSKASYEVELVDVGRLVVKSGWYNKHAILPAGFRSRVPFPDYLNLPGVCYYVSEVLDCTDGKPLFKVSMEDRPAEKFVCSSIDICWQGIQERVNSEIKRLRQSGRTHLPPLRPPESVKGIDLFGLTSRSIAEAIEVLDPTHLCSSYWKSRSHLRSPHKEDEDVKPSVFGDDSSRYASFKALLSDKGRDQLSELQQILGSKWTADEWFRR